MPIRSDLSAACIDSLARKLGVTTDAAALGIVNVACARMVKAIRAISVERGHSPRDFVLFVYGGAGPLHATDVARDLGIGRIVVPPNPGILCAEGAMNAPLSVEFVRTILAPLDAGNAGVLREASAVLGRQVEEWFAREEVPAAQRRTAWTVGARYVGQNYELTLPLELSLDDRAMAADMAEKFHAAHETSYGFAARSEPIQIVNLAVKALGMLEIADLPQFEPAEPGLPRELRETLFAGTTRVSTPVFDREALTPGHVIVGPAIIEQMDTTVLVFPGDSCAVDRWGNLVIDVRETVR
jgi:N-methylhydantoinase A